MDRNGWDELMQTLIRCRMHEINSLWTPSSPFYTGLYGAKSKRYLIYFDYYKIIIIFV